jgi:hypothetical protein
MSTPISNPPDERGPASPLPDAQRPALDGKDPRWQFVHDRFREGHAAAVLGQIEAPTDPTALALLKASSAALRAFGDVYQEASTASVARQLGKMGG